MTSKSQYTPAASSVYQFGRSQKTGSVFLMDPADLVEPSHYVVPAIISIVFMPIFGLLAVYFAVLSRKTWRAFISNPQAVNDVAQRRNAYESSRYRGRVALLLTLISFGLGILVLNIVFMILLPM